jgi:hypothetical protein
MSARELYEKNIRQLPALERLRLATLILDELTAANGAGLDVCDEWTDEDISELAAYSLKHGASAAPAEDSDA